MVKKKVWIIRMILENGMRQKQQEVIRMGVVFSIFSRGRG
jgi:hypothetical protein